MPLLGGAGSTIQVGNNATSAATINVKGGKLTLGGPLDRSNTCLGAPVIGLTGGILEFNPTAAVCPDFGKPTSPTPAAKLITKPRCVAAGYTLADATHCPANFAMSERKLEY